MQEAFGTALHVRAASRAVLLDGGQAASSTDHVDHVDVTCNLVCAT
jgi:hypothetical protein